MLISILDCLGPPCFQVCSGDYAWDVTVSQSEPPPATFSEGAYCIWLRVQSIRHGGVGSNPVTTIRAMVIGENGLVCLAIASWVVDRIRSCKPCEFVGANVSDSQFQMASKAIYPCAIALVDIAGQGAPFGVARSK